jgi:hypothetical protein
MHRYGLVSSGPGSGVGSAGFLSLGAAGAWRFEGLIVRTLLVGIRKNVHADGVAID